MNTFRLVLIYLFMITIADNRLYSFTINRVVMACDANPMYLDFWPLVSQAWVKLIGIRPVLALISKDEVKIDTAYGDVVRFDPIEGVSTGLYAQTIRLLLPALFPDEISIISDIDMLPIKKSYFVDCVKNISSDKFVVYRDKAYALTGPYDQYPMCYNAGKGKLFQEIFGVRDISDIPRIIREWANKGFGWNTDEKILYASLHAWEKFKTHCVRLGHDVAPRIDRSSWIYKEKKVVEGYYVDSHMVRPYNKYKGEIDLLANLLGLQI